MKMYDWDFVVADTDNNLPNPLRQEKQEEKEQMIRN